MHNHFGGYIQYEIYNRQNLSIDGLEVKMSSD